MPPRDGVWRVGRGDDPLKFSRPDPATLTASSGNRFDTGNFGVLYFASSLEACFGETLARFRPSPELVSLIGNEWQERGFMEVGAVPADWRLRRTAVRVKLPESRPYVDIEHVDTHQYLRQRLAPGLAQLDYDDLNVGIVRGPDRRVSRLISGWAYNAAELVDVDEEGQPIFGDYLYNGIRYLSKFKNEWECWALFEEEYNEDDFEVLETKPITPDMPELQKIAAEFGLRIH